MSEDAVLYERDGAIGLLTLNRPDNRNSMTPELLDAFGAACRRARGDTAVRCIVVTGRGRCFSAGADFRSDIQRKRGGRRLKSHEASYAMYEPFLSMLDFEVPVIAAMNGHAVGGGFGLSLMCDIRIAKVDASYGANFVRLGLCPGLGISYLLPRLVGASRAAEWLFTGRLVDGAEGERAGLFSAALPAPEVLPRALGIAADIAAASPYAVRSTKTFIYQGLGWDVRQAARAESFAQAASIESDDAREGISAMLQKREPIFGDD